MAAACRLFTARNPAFAQGTAFTYQGCLNDANGPASGSYDLTFPVFGINAGGAAIAGPVRNSAAVGNGLFTTTIDFGSAPFAHGASRWLEIGVTASVPRLNGTNTFTGTNIFSGGIIATNSHHALSIENRASDPPNPAVGQIWLRSHL